MLFDDVTAHHCSDIIVHVTKHSHLVWRFLIHPSYKCSSLLLKLLLFMLKTQCCLNLQWKIYRRTSTLYQLVWSLIFLENASLFFYVSGVRLINNDLLSFVSLWFSDKYAVCNSYNVHIIYTVSKETLLIHTSKEI